MMKYLVMMLAVVTVLPIVTGMANNQMCAEFNYPPQPANGVGRQGTLLIVAF